MLECALCSFKHKHTLVDHITTEHKLTLEEYGKQFRNRQVVSDEVHALVVNNVHRVGSKRNPIQLDQGQIKVKLGRGKEVAFDSYQNQDKSLIPARDKDYVFTDTLRYLAIAVKENLNSYQSGPTGAGKSQGVLQLASLLGKSLIRFNMNGQVTQSDFIGKTDLDGKTYFNYGPLPRAMKEGHWLLIDEIDFAPPPVLHLLQAMLEDSYRRLFIPATNETIVPHADFRVFATGNTKGRGDESGLYTGTEILNSAFLGRFQLKIKVAYLPQAQEVKVLLSKSDHLTPEEATKMVQAANQVRDRIEKGEFFVTFGTNTLLNWARNAKYCTLGEAAKVTFLDFWPQDEARAMSELLIGNGLMARS